MDAHVHGDDPSPILASLTTRQKRPRLRAVRIWMMRALLLLLFFCGFFLTIFPQGRATTRSALLLPALLTTSQQAPFRWSSEPITHTQMTATSSGGTIDLDVYAPSASAPLVAQVRSGILVLSGVGDNRQEPQLVNFLSALAHTGIVVMNLTTPALSNYMLSAHDSNATVQAFQTLEHLPNMQGKQIGMIAISAGVPLVCLAAADPRIRAKVSYVVGFGGYFNAKSLLRDMGRRAQDIDGNVVPWQPIAIPIQVLANTTGQALAPAERSMLINAFAQGGTALTEAQIAHLSPAAQAIYRLLAGTDPKDVDANLRKLSPAMQTLLEQLSPSRVVRQIRAPVYLLHDRADPSLPVSGTRAFAATLAHLHHPYRYVEMHIFDHVRVRAHLSDLQVLSDGWQLFSMLHDVMAYNS